MSKPKLNLDGRDPYDLTWERPPKPMKYYDSRGCMEKTCPPRCRVKFIKAFHCVYCKRMKEVLFYSTLYSSACSDCCSVNSSTSSEYNTSSELPKIQYDSPSCDGFFIWTPCCVPVKRNVTLEKEVTQNMELKNPKPICTQPKLTKVGLETQTEEPLNTRGKTNDASKNSDACNIQTVTVEVHPPALPKPINSKDSGRNYKGRCVSNDSHRINDASRCPNSASRPLIKNTRALRMNPVTGHLTKENQSQNTQGRSLGPQASLTNKKIRFVTFEDSHRLNHRDHRVSSTQSHPESMVDPCVISRCQLQCMKGVRVSMRGSHKSIQGSYLSAGAYCVNTETQHLRTEGQDWDIQTPGVFSPQDCTDMKGNSVTYSGDSRRINVESINPVSHPGANREDFKQQARSTMLSLGLNGASALRSELENMIACTKNETEMTYLKRCQTELDDFVAMERVSYGHKHRRRSEILGLCPDLPTIVISEERYRLSLEQVVIVGKCNQPKAFDLSVDMYRMARFFSETYSYQDIKVPQPMIETMFMPRPTEIINSVSNAANALSTFGALCLYISADDGPQPVLTPEQYTFDTSGLLSSANTDAYESLDIFYQTAQCLHPGDLLPFMRHPMFIIIESSGAKNFKHIKNVFGTPLVVLMAPAEKLSYPEYTLEFGLLTLFLTQPLNGLFFLTDTPLMEITNLNTHLRVTKYLEDFTQQVLILYEHLYYSSNKYMARFIEDTALQPLLVNYIFCRVAFNLHAKSRENPHLIPTSIPPMDEICQNKILHLIMWEIINNLGINKSFIKPVPEKESKLSTPEEEILI